MNPCPLPQPSPVGLVFFTDASGESALTPISGRATLQLNHTGGHYHMDHHTGRTTYGASSHGELQTMADAIAKIADIPPVLLPRVIRVWLVVDTTVHTHLLLRIARQSLHKATATSLGTQAVMLWKALCSLPPYVLLHIVKQESHRHQYGNGKVNIQAEHQRATHVLTLQVPDLGCYHTHLQHIPPEPERPLYLTRQSIPLFQPHPTSRPSTPEDGQAHIRELGETVEVPLYHSALRPE